MPSRARALPWLVAAVLAVLLAALATLQYHWIGQVSALERQRMRSRLVAAGSALAADFDRELTRAFLAFHPELAPSAGRLERLPAQLEHWRRDAPWPELLRDLFVARRGASGEAELLAFSPQEGRFLPAAWPPELAPVRRRFAAGASERVSFPWDRPAEPEVPALVLPLALFPSPGAARGAGEEALLVVRLSEPVIAGRILPELARRHFGDPERTDVALAVLTPRGRPIYRSDPDLPLAAFERADVGLEMLGLRPIDEMRDVGPPGGSAEPRRRRHPHLHLFGMAPRSREAPHGRAGGAGWRLLVRHREGSLEAAVARVRRHNLAVSLGILALLAATSALLVATAQRAERLARQRIELVAGVTHELNTPLTAIRSAGQNLADGVVADPAQVRRYGALIEREGRRLTDLVAQTLELAGIQSGRRPYRLRPEPVETLVDGALEDCRGLLDEAGAAIEKRIPDGLLVLADEAALRRALRNLIENAIRHGGPERWVGLAARAAAGGSEVEITVGDRGRGIRREELTRLLEPFERGREAVAKGVPGSGLGLSVVRQVVEAHGGRVTVAADGPGSAFTLHLPAASGGEAA